VTVVDASRPKVSTVVGTVKASPRSLAAPLSLSLSLSLSNNVAGDGWQEDHGFDVVLSAVTYCGKGAIHRLRKPIELSLVSG
jgi:hypothetical protein